MDILGTLFSSAFKIGFERFSQVIMSPENVYLHPYQKIKQNRQCGAEL